MIRSGEKIFDYSAWKVIADLIVFVTVEAALRAFQWNIDCRVGVKDYLKNQITQAGRISPRKVYFSAVSLPSPSTISYGLSLSSSLVHFLIFAKKYPSLTDFLVPFSQRFVHLEWQFTKGLSYDVEKWLNYCTKVPQQDIAVMKVAKLNSAGFLMIFSMDSDCSLSLTSTSAFFRLYFLFSVPSALFLPFPHPLFP